HNWMGPGAGRTRGVRHIDCAVRSVFDVPMNPAVTLRGREDIYSRTKCKATIVAARTFGPADNVLRTIVDGVRVERMRWWRRSRSFVVGTAAESFMIGAGRSAPALGRCPRFSIVI